MDRVKGMTLIELLLALGMLSLLLVFALPDLGDWVDSARARQFTRVLASQIAVARRTAITQRQRVSFCPSVDMLVCSRHWTQGSMVFTDRNGDLRVNQDDVAIRLNGQLPAGETLEWRAFQGLPYLQVQRDGFLRHQSGNFTWCPASRDVRYARQLVINATGRVRVSHDRDGDGVDEDSAGNPLRCP
jgi:type IV fimbrial biogenesis protein FimT